MGGQGEVVFVPGGVAASVPEDCKQCDKDREVGGVGGANTYTAVLSVYVTRLNVDNVGKSYI